MKIKIVDVIFFSLYLFLSGCAGKYIEKVDIQEKQNFHLFLLAGQSNMAGRGIVSEEDNEPDARILMLNNDNEWVQAIDPIHYDKTNAGVGLAKSFAQKLLISDSTISIGLIPTACGGAPISTWEPGGYHDQTKSYPYDDAIARTRIAMKSGELKGILWHQGESDCNPKSSVQYYDNLKNLIFNFRKDLNSENIPFIIGQLGQFPNMPWSESRKLVDKAHRLMQNEIEFVGFVSSDGLTSKSDNIHFNTNSQRDFGKRYANVYLQLVK